MMGLKKIVMGTKLLSSRRKRRGRRGRKWENKRVQAVMGEAK